MKKLISLVIAALMIVAVFAACTSDSAQPSQSSSQSADATPSSEPNGSSAISDDPYADVEPLAERTKLVVCQLAGGPHSAMSYIIEKLGGYEKANIEIEYVVMGNGNVMVEALNTWDVATYGVGGVFSGISKEGTYILGNSMHDTGFRFFVRPDHPIALEGNTIPDKPSLLGSAETWNGVEINMPSGTTLHAILIDVLKNFGLTGDAVKITHMDVANANTAFRAGNGDMCGLWPPLSLAPDMDEKFVCVADSTKLGLETGNCMVANINSYNDPKKTLAIKKWLELFFKGSEWCYKNDENLLKAAEWFNEWNESCGSKSTVETSLESLEVTPLYLIEENVPLFTETVEYNGKQITKAQKMQCDVLELFVSMGNFEQKVLDDMQSDKYFKPDYLFEIAEMMGKA